MAESSDSAGPRRNETLSAETLHNLLTSIAVIHAHAQLLERWVRRSDPAYAELMLTRLEIITTMVWRVVLQLDELREADLPGADPDDSGADP